MGSPWYKIMLGMSYYIYAGGLGALKALPGSVSKIVTPVAGFFHAWEANDSSLLNVLMPDGFPIAPQWISPILTASLTATECRSASESAENVSLSVQGC